MDAAQVQAERSLAERLGAQLRASLAESASGQPDWARAQRERAVGDFERNGLPTVRVEAWKYTSLRDLEGRLAGLGEAAAPSNLPAVSLSVDPGCRVVLADGEFAGCDGAPADGVQLLPLREALESGVPGLEDLLAGLETDHPAQAFSALNSAALGPGLVVRVPAGVDAGRLLLQFEGANEDALFNSRVCLLLEEDARLELIEHHPERGGVDPAPTALNLVVQATLARGAELRHARLQEADAAATLFTRTVVEQGPESRYAANGLDLGGQLVRHDIQVTLAGAGAVNDLDGAYLPSGRSHVDVHLAVDHAAPDCHSSQFYRGVLDDHGRAVFNGRVHVCPGADGTEAHQSNANLLLSRDAEIDTKPELEIEADEVVASHGATVGQLDETAVFYLRSRGLDEAAARQMLTGAFCRAAVERLPEGPVREAFALRLAARLERSS